MFLVCKMTAQGEKPCAIFVWAAEAYGAGRDESLPFGSTVNGRFREAAGRACPAPTARHTV